MLRITHLVVSIALLLLTLNAFSAYAAPPVNEEIVVRGDFSAASLSLAKESDKILDIDLIIYTCSTSTAGMADSDKGALTASVLGETEKGFSPPTVLADRLGGSSSGSSNAKWRMIATASMDSRIGAA